MEQIINQLINHFDFSYMLVVNILTYIWIKILDAANGVKAVPIWQKRVSLVIAAIFVACAYISVGYKDYIVLINSAILAPVAWSWILRPAINKIGLGYKQKYR